MIHKQLLLMTQKPAVTPLMAAYLSHTVAKFNRSLWKIHHVDGILQQTMGFSTDFV